MTIPRHPADWIALNLLPGLGSIGLQRLLDRHGDPHEIAFSLPAKQVAASGRRTDADKINEARRGLRARVDAEIRLAERLGARIVTRENSSYPAALLEIHDPPILLYVRGRMEPGRPRIAIVGSRAATRYGRSFATEISAELVRYGFEVVSGGARGIDTCAHRGALDADGVTLAVLGSGLAQPYPPENAALFERIVERGAVLSEFPLTCPPSVATFPRRNRLVSGLCAAVVVVEAEGRSGALITARTAMEQGREVMAVPGPANSSRSVGTHRLIQDGAKLVLGIEDIISELSPLYQPEPTAGNALTAGKDEPDLRDLTADERLLLELLDPVEPVHLDTLADDAPFGVARLQVALFGLQVRGAIDLEPGCYYLLRPSRR